MNLTRRTVVLAGATTLAVAALPLAVGATMQEPTLVADMFYTEDEPWGAFVRGHVSKERFDKAVLQMLETNSDHRENGEDWLFEYQYIGEDEDEERIRVIVADPEFMHMKIDYIDPDLGEQYVFCKGGDIDAIPISVARY